jgi:hypothetical protein
LIFSGFYGTPKVLRVPVDKLSDPQREGSTPGARTPVTGAPGGNIMRPAVSVSGLVVRSCAHPAGPFSYQITSIPHVEVSDGQATVTLVALG